MRGSIGGLGSELVNVRIKVHYDFDGNLEDLDVAQAASATVKARSLRGAPDRPAAAFKNHLTWRWIGSHLNVLIPWLAIVLIALDVSNVSRLVRSEVVLAAIGLLLAGWIGASTVFRMRSQLTLQTGAAEAASKRFEGMFEQVAVGMALVGPDGRWLRVNDRFCAMVAKSREELIGERFETITHPDDLADDLAHLDDFLTGRQDQCTSEKRYLLASGDFVWANISARIVRGADGAPDFIVKVIKDITDRKVAEESLRKSEKRLRLALAAGNMGTWSIDTTTGHIDVDSIAREIYDWKPGWTPNLFESEQLIHPDDRARFAKLQKDIIALSPTRDVEYRFLQRDGSFRWVRHAATLIRDEESGGTRMIGINWDITEQREANDRLRIGEERLRLTLLSGRLGTWTFDPQAEVITFDKLAMEIFGLESDQLAGLEQFKALLHPEDHVVFEQELKLLRDGSNAINVEYRLLDGDEAVRWVRLNGTIDRSVRSESQNLIGVVVDVTEEHEADERLRLLQNEFAHLGRVNDLGEMAAAIAHEINQPLTAISNYLNAGLETARRSPESAAQAGVGPLMESAAEQAQRAGLIVRRLREFIGRGSGEREARSADDLIDAVTQFSSVGANVNGVTVVRNAGAGDALVNVDVVQFQQVVVNLIRNAMDALSTNARGVERRLTVETKIGDSGTTVEFMVADTGPGLAKDISPKLFEPFTTSKPHGMGMGLSIAKRLIEAHGGSIWVESPASGGAAFHFELPIKPISA